MRKIQIDKIIKKFDEFNKDEQKEILNNYRYINVDYQDWNDYILSDFIEEVKQKTGLEIESDYIIWAVANKNSNFGVYSKEVVNQLLSRFADNGVYDINTTEKLGSFLNHLGGGIYKQGQTESGLAAVYFEKNEQQQAEQNKGITKEINNIIDEVILLCSKYHNKNEEAFNYAVSDEAVKYAIEANDYNFYVETKRIY